MKKILVAFMFGLLSMTAFAEASFQQIESLIDKQQYAAAEQGLEGIIANHPNSAKAFYAMAQAQAGLGHLDKAQFALNKAKGLDPELKFASSSNIESLEQAITPQVKKIEVVQESHALRNFILFAMFAGFFAACYFFYGVYTRKQEQEEAARKFAEAELKAERDRERERMRQEREAREAEEAAKEAALRAHKNYGHERFDPANPDKLKTVKQMKEEKAAQELREAQARAERAELDARLARSNASSGPAYSQPTTTVVNNGGSGDFVTGMLVGNMLSGSHHDHTTVIERETVREMPAPSRDSSWDSTPAPTPSRSSSWDDDSSSSKSSSSWSDSSSSDSSWSSSSDSGSSWSDSSSSSDSSW